MRSFSLRGCWEAEEGIKSAEQHRRWESKKKRKRGLVIGGGGTARVRREEEESPELKRLGSTEG